MRLVRYVSALAFLLPTVCHAQYAFTYTVKGVSGSSCGDAIANATTLATTGSGSLTQDQVQSRQATNISQATALCASLTSSGSATASEPVLGDQAWVGLSLYQAATNDSRCSRDSNTGNYYTTQQVGGVCYLPE